MTFSPALPADYRVRLAVFEGPLDLLLTLVQRAALDITAVALAEVTDQFLRHLERLEAVDAGALAAFCDTAATLMLIKSRALLPREADTLDDEPEAAALLDRLREVARYRAASEHLGERERRGLRAFARVAPPREHPAPVVAGAGEPADLAAAFRAALADAAREEIVPRAPGIRPHPVRLVERFHVLREALLRHGRITFREAVLGDRPSGASPREFVIVSFLALLELLRRAAVTVVQDDLFAEILIEATPALATVSAPGEEGTFDAASLPAAGDDHA